MNKDLAPLIIIGFHRAGTLRAVLDRVYTCDLIERTPIYVYMDKALKPDEKADEAREMVCRYQAIHKDLNICFRDTPFGCFRNVTEAVSSVINEYGRVIVIEDDILVSRTFLSYMNEALDTYRGRDDIWCVNAYQSPYFSVPLGYGGDVYLAPHNQTGGWATWKEKWNGVDFKLSRYKEYVSSPELRRKVASCSAFLPAMLKRQVETSGFEAWDVACSFHMAINALYAVEPRYSLTKNIGFGEGGLHTDKKNDIFAKQRYYDFRPKLIADVQPNSRLLKKYRDVSDFRRFSRGWFGRQAARLRTFFRGSNDLPIKIR